MSDFAKRAETLAAGYLPRTELQRLLDALVSTGYRCVGPRVRDGAIQYLPLDRADEFPVGVRDHQEPGSYRVEVVDERPPRCGGGLDDLPRFRSAPMEAPVPENLQRVVEGDRPCLVQPDAEDLRLRRHVSPGIVAAVSGHDEGTRPG